MARIIFFIFIFVFTSCLNLHQVDRRKPLPEHWKNFGTIKGVNLPHLSPYPRTREFLNHPDLLSNFSQLEFNTFRFPVLWDEFVTNGKDFDPNLIDYAAETFQNFLETISKLPHKSFVIVDFHQFVLGKRCGGVGFPNSFFDNMTIDSKDPNCLFIGFNQFWNNQNNVQDQFLIFATSFLKKVIPYYLRYSDKIILGIEPLNEPQFGFDKSIIPKELPDNFINKIKLVLNIKRSLDSKQMNFQIHRYLLPFYRSFLYELEKEGILELLHQKPVTFLFEPFVLDYVGLFIKVLGIPFSLSPKGEYGSAIELFKHGEYPLHWMAAPHHYYGAYDRAFQKVAPTFLHRYLKTYPNALFNKHTLNQRTEQLSQSMHHAGMEVFFGEWGTEMLFVDKKGRKTDDYIKFIKESQESIQKHTIGALWWVYNYDSSPDEQSYYMLKKIPNKHILKCSLTIPLFQKCLKE